MGMLLWVSCLFEKYLWIKGNNYYIVWHIIKKYIFVTNKDIDQLKKCYKLVHLQNQLIYVCINGFKQHSINHKSKYITDQLLRFCCIEITSDYRDSSILSGILQGNKKLSSTL